MGKAGRVSAIDARKAARSWAAAALLCAAGAGAMAQGLPPLPRAATAAAAKNKPAEPAPAPVAVELPLLSPAPQDLPKSDAPCAALPDKGVSWLLESLGRLQAQTLRPSGAPKARDAFADVWLFFKAARDKGYDLDGYGMRVEAVYKALYPAGAFAPDSPFERFKEPRRSCKKSAAPAPP